MVDPPSVTSARKRAGEGHDPTGESRIQRQAKGECTAAFGWGVLKGARLMPTGFYTVSFFKILRIKVVVS